VKKILSAIDHLPIGIIVILCDTLGLAPFSPPHVIEKLSMLVDGSLVKPIDWFDLILHGIPWILLVLKLIALARTKPGNPEKKLIVKNPGPED